MSAPVLANGALGLTIPPFLRVMQSILQGAGEMIE